MRYNQAHRLAGQLNASNVEFVPPVSYAGLPGEIAAADLCLGGPFGNTPKAHRVIPGKIFQFLAMRRPMIATDTPANRELLTHGRDAYLIPTADPEALAAAISLLQEDVMLREMLAARGYERYQQQCSEAVIREALHHILFESARSG
jgi:glycosyltransferase involved in cell wall biosynthesis